MVMLLTLMLKMGQPTDDSQKTFDLFICQSSSICYKAT